MATVTQDFYYTINTTQSSSHNSRSSRNSQNNHQMTECSHVPRRPCYHEWRFCQNLQGHCLDGILPWIRADHPCQVYDRDRPGRQLPQKNVTKMAIYEIRQVELMFFILPVITSAFPIKALLIIPGSSLTPHSIHHCNALERGGHQIYFRQSP